MAHARHRTGGGSAPAEECLMVPRRHRTARPWGSLYKQPTSRFWWLQVKFPGEKLIRRSTGTEDEAEASRQLHELLAERSPQRRQRRTADQTTVADLLDLVLLDCADHGRVLQVGRIEPWYAAFGTMLTTEVERADVDDRCRRWRRHGPTWGAGARALSDGGTVTWPARPRERVRPLSGASCNRLVAVLRRAFKLGQEKLGLMTALTFPHFDERGRGEYITEDQC